MNTRSDSLELSFSQCWFQEIVWTSLVAFSVFFLGGVIKIEAEGATKSASVSQLSLGLPCNDLWLRICSSGLKPCHRVHSLTRNVTQVY